MHPTGHYALGAYDRPVLRDWAFWWSIAWGLLFLYTTAYSSSPPITTAPRWIDSLFAGLLGFWLLGYPAALIRRGVRGFRHGRQTRHLPPPVSPQVQPNPNPNPNPLYDAPAPGPIRSDAGWSASASLPHVSPPVSVSAYSGSASADSRILDQARISLPYPIARAARALHVSQDPIEQHQSILDLAEVITESVGALATVWLREHRAFSPVLEDLHEAYHRTGVSQGHWHKLISAAEKAMRENEDKALPNFVTGVAKSSRHPSLVSDLGALLEERNRTAHGGRPHNRAEAAVRVTEYFPIVERAVGRVFFMSRLPWVLVNGVAYRRKDKMFVVQTGVAMNDHPEFESRIIVLPMPLANDTFYVLRGDEELPLDLTPFFVHRYCDTCHQPEVFFADRVSESKGVSLKSVGRGHQIFDQGLASEFDSLLGPQAQASAAD